MRLTPLENRIVVMQLRTLIHWIKAFNKAGRGNIDEKPIKNLLEKFYKEKRLRT